MRIEEPNENRNLKWFGSANEEDLRSVPAGGSPGGRTGGTDCPRDRRQLTSHVTHITETSADAAADNFLRASS